MGCFESKNEHTVDVTAFTEEAVHDRPTQTAARTNSVEDEHDLKPNGMIKGDAKKSIEPHSNNQLQRDEKIKTAVQSDTYRPNRNETKDKAKEKSKEFQQELNTPEKRNSEHDTKQAHGDEKTKTAVQSDTYRPKRNETKDKAREKSKEFRQELNTPEKRNSEHDTKQAHGDEKTKTAVQSDTYRPNRNETKDKARGKSKEFRQELNTPEKRNSEHDTKQAHGFGEYTKANNKDEPFPPERTKKENKELREKIESLESEREMLKKELKRSKDELQTSKSSSEKEKQELQKNIKYLEEEIDVITKNADKNMEEMKQDVKKKTADIQRLKSEHNKMQSEKEDLIKNQETTIIGKTKKIQSLEKEKDELLYRLSAMAGRRLTDNNPDITDLSDTNRPTKLAERYSELYDNEWTEAFQYLETIDDYKNSEEEIISTLLEMLKVAYEVSFSTAEKQLGDLSRILSDFRESSVRGVNMNDILKQMKDYRKKAVKPNERMAKEYRRKVGQALPRLSVSSFESDALKDYLHRCLQLSWLMVIQDPPVHLESEVGRRGDTFNKNYYKEYTTSGNFVLYAVWPALFLKKNGPLLCKGVVQCSKQKLTGSFRLREPKINETSQEMKTQSLNVEKTVTKLSINETGLGKDVNKEKNKNDKTEGYYYNTTKF